MAFFENCVERATALAATCGWLVFGGGAEAAVGVAIGAAGLSAVVSDAVRSHGPESRAELAKIRRSIRADLERFASAEGWDSRADLDAADRAMESALAGCFLGRSELAQSACDPRGFPEAASRLILAKLAEREPAVFGPGGPPAARDYARVVVRSALIAALESEEYFRRLEPHLLMEALRSIGRVQERQAEIHGDVKTIQGMVLEVLRRLPDTDKFEMTSLKIELVVNDRSEAVVFYNRELPWSFHSFEYEMKSRRLTFCFGNGFKKDFGTPVHPGLTKYLENRADGRMLMVLCDDQTGAPVEGDYFPLKVFSRVN